MILSNQGIKRALQEEAVGGAAPLVLFKGAGFDFAALALRTFASPTRTKQRAEHLSLDHNNQYVIIVA
jgi:hypothetical protein